MKDLGCVFVASTPCEVLSENQSLKVLTWLERTTNSRNTETVSRPSISHTCMMRVALSLIFAFVDSRRKNERQCGGMLHMNRLTQSHCPQTMKSNEIILQMLHRSRTHGGVRHAGNRAVSH
eukprot:Selendium_serpulae@DN2125_c0_g1_i1.p1